MGTQDKEIELRFNVRNMAKLLKWLKTHAKLIKTSRQVDEYFTPRHRDFIKPNQREWLRIRNQEGTFSVTYKNWHNVTEGSEGTHCDEYETELESGSSLRKIFLTLDFRPLVFVDKKRTAYTYECFEIAVDIVKGLGYFCEIEAKTCKTVSEARKKIKQLAEELGFTEEDRGEILKLGYPMMLIQKREF